ncbi:MAG TPA: V-type ATP synthase subunit D [Anaerolineaceae bacterium]|jgi:V/A-type H+-transporting ATPase subunit D|nr:V-type ATP synthase subunit D [Anaerolineaceae bacterium]
MIDVSNITVTRNQLLATKQQLGLTRQGYELLDKKRIALIQKIVELERKVLEEAQRLQLSTNQAKMALVRAEAFVGEGRVKAASLGAQSEYSIELDEEIVMGVRVPKIRQKRDEEKESTQPYVFNSISSMIEEAGVAFRNNVADILKLADEEVQLTALLKEIAHTTRRLKALELIVIPRLQGEYAYIRDELDERERADHFRLKQAKNIIEQRNVKDQARI